MEHQTSISKPETAAITEDVVGVDVPPLVVRLPSKERGCEGKIDISGKYTRKVDSFSKKHGKPFGAYRCPHCNGVHMTSKLTAEKRKQYGPLLYVSSHNDCILP